MLTILCSLTIHIIIGTPTGADQNNLFVVVRNDNLFMDNTIAVGAVKIQKLLKQTKGVPVWHDLKPKGLVCLTVVA
jgi:hypothetical protein